MYPSSFREDRLGPVAGVDRIGLAPALAQPVEPFGSDNADDVGEVRPSRAWPALHRDQAIELGKPHRPLCQRAAHPGPRRQFVEAAIAGTMSQTFIGEHFQEGQLTGGEVRREIRR